MRHNLIVERILCLTLPGSEIIATIKEAIVLAKEQQCKEIEFRFNGITVKVAENSDPEHLCRDYSRSMSGLIPEKTIGPYPNPFLSEEEMGNDARIRAEKNNSE